MGEAKRRKQIDPNYGKVRYGKVRNQPEIWYKEMLANLPQNFRMDEGHRLYRSNGNAGVIIMIDGIIRVGNDRQGKMIQVNGEGSVLSLIVTNEQYENTDWTKLPMLFCLPMLDERYQPYTGEWVLPYQVVDIQQNPISPGKIPTVKNMYQETVKDTYQENETIWDNILVKEIITYCNYP